MPKVEGLGVQVVQKKGLVLEWHSIDSQGQILVGAMGDIEGILVVHKQDSIPDKGFRLNEAYYIWIHSNRF
jgi:hypothetical protein